MRGSDYVVKELALWYVCNVYLHRRAVEERLIGVKLLGIWVLYFLAACLSQ